MKDMKEQTQSEIKRSCPNYYQSNGIEVKNFIALNNLDFFLGNVVKYIARSGKKPGCSKQDDLLKAIHNLAFEIEDQNVNMYGLHPTDIYFEEIENFISAFEIGLFAGIALRLIFYAKCARSETTYTETLKTALIFLETEMQDF